MQTQKPIEMMMACSCRIEQKNHVWVRVGELCAYCKAWQESMTTNSLEPLKEFKDGLERTYGSADANRENGDSQAF